MQGDWCCVHGIETDKHCVQCSGVLVGFKVIEEFICHRGLQCYIKCECGLDELTDKLGGERCTSFPG